MTAPRRPLICLATALLLLLSNSPGLLQAALVRAGAAHCHCGGHRSAHAGVVPDEQDGHCHHQHDDADDDGDDPTGAGVLSEDHQHCPCCPLKPRSTCGCCLVHAPFFAAPVRHGLPLTPALVALSPEASLLFPFVTPVGLIRPPRA